MLFIKYSVVNNLDIHPITLHMDNWIVYHGIKGLCIFVSIVSFSLVHKFYKYRERDKIVNEQAMQGRNHQIGIGQAKFLLTINNQ